MSFFKILFLGLFCILIGGFIYFSITDVPIHQTEKIESLPTSHFQK